MTTKAVVKEFNFTVSVKVGDVWQDVARYEARKSSVPAAVVAFTKWFNGWLVDSTTYRVDGVDMNGEIIYQWSHVHEWDAPLLPARVAEGKQGDNAPTKRSAGSHGMLSQIGHSLDTVNVESAADVGSAQPRMASLSISGVDEYKQGDNDLNRTLGQVGSGLDIVNVESAADIDNARP